MKNLLLLLFVILAGSISAQTLQPVNADIQLPENTSSMNGVNSLVKTTTACGPDTNGYALAKATGLQALDLNNSSSATGVGQYFDAPQAITISGVSFYAWKADATGGISQNATVQVYAAALDSTPLGMPLASGTVLVDTVFGTGTLDVLRKNVTFATPITISSAYVVVVSNQSPNSISMVFNNWGATPTPDGGSEWLSSALIGANWLRSYGVTIGTSVFNADCLVEPHITYDLTAAFTIDDLCNLAGSVSTFTNGSSPIGNHRMYNVAAYQAVPQFSYTWNYGDASATENVVDATHTYATSGNFTLTLTDTIYGWTTNCVSDSIVVLNVVDPAVSSFSSVESILTSTFTNSSTAGAGITYSWDFGDGNTSTSTNPVHTYATDGTYTVCLTVTDACGSITTCSPVTVGCPIPVPAFTSTATSQTIDFTNSSTTSMTASYLWDFGDGNTSTLMDPTHTYAADGNYTVCMTVSDICGTDSTCQTVSVTTCVAPVPGFTTAGTSPTFDFTNTSTTTGTTTYAWSFGDGNTVLTMDASNTYATNGTFTVTLVVSDSCGLDSITGTVDVSGIGLNELTLADVAVYPNPSNGIFSIDASAGMKSAYISDLSGKLIYSEALTGNKAEINAAQFANGTYLLSIRFDNDLIQTVRLKVVN